MKLLLLALLAVASVASAQVTVTHLVIPNYPGAAAQTTSGSANQLVCARLVAPYSISGATHITGGVTTGTGGASCGFAIYDDADGGTRRATTGAVSCAAAANITASVSSFSLTQGTIYRICYCSTATSTVVFMTVQDSATGTGHMADMMNQVSTFVGTAANGCSSGAPPTTTGALSASTGFRLPIVVVE